MHGHAHHNHERKVEDLEERGNVVIVYQTMDADFDGPVGGYRTGDPGTTEAETATHKNVGVGPAVGATATAKTTETKATDEATTTSKEEATTTKETEAHTTQTSAQSTETTKAETTEKTAKQASTTESQSTATSFVTSASPTAETSQDVNDLLAATSTGSATDSAASASSTAIGSSTTSAGMSGGAKAGVAIGVILGVGVIAALIFFIVRKKKRSQDGYQQENEKAFGGEGLPEGGLAASLPPPPPKPQTPSTPPVLNVRPVTQFAPDLSGGGGIYPATAGAAGAAAGSAAIASRNLTGDSPPPTPPKSAGSSPNPFNDPVNPFGTADTPVSAHAPSVSESSNGPSGSTMAAAAVGTAAAGAVAGAAATSHESKEETARPGTAGSRAHSPTVSPQSSTSPVNVAFSAAAAGPTVELAGAAAGGPNNVHRVQLDFNPSMEDELGLRSGSLVRLLHEYDDGWALCIRLDRSQQGVAPRSCLSARPVMPRPRPPPGSRGPPIMGPDGRPMAPPGRFYPQDARPRSPSGPGFAGPPGSYPGTQMSPVQFPAVPRSMSPGPGRPSPRAMSPGPGGMPVPRSMSPGPGGMPGPRSMSPGPGRPSPRSMSPGPYGHPGMQRPQMPINQRQRSNSAGNMAPPNIAAAAPPVSSPLAAPVPAPTGELPAIPSSAPTSPTGSQVSRKPVPAQDA
ncbi:hypothetical protein N7522_013162 [Penicillium canescens]|nr:hypothetical protein N7522_013162 [Penicillium canescens]